MGIILLRIVRKPHPVTAMSNQAEQYDSNNKSKRNIESEPDTESKPDTKSNYDLDPHMHIGPPPFLRNTNIGNRLSFKQYMAITAVYSVGKSLLDTWNSSSQAQEHRHRREAEEREREEREAQEAAKERERRERKRQEALERLMQDL